MGKLRLISSAPCQAGRCRRISLPADILHFPPAFPCDCSAISGQTAAAAVSNTTRTTPPISPGLSFHGALFKESLRISKQTWKSLALYEKNNVNSTNHLISSTSPHPFIIMNLTPRPLFHLALLSSFACVSFPYADASINVLKERQNAILKVVSQSGKSVINLGGIGSGVVVSKDGLILTAAHVVDALDSPALRRDKDKNEFDVTLADGREVKAKALGRNRNRDAALAQITTPGEYEFSAMADETSIKQGDWCVAMGHPGGLLVDRSAPVRTGRIWQKDDKAYFRSDCTVSGGDSGGPLFDLQGKVIGIHSSIGERLEENRHVPIGAYKENMDRMKKGDAWGQLSKLMPELAPFDRAHGGNEDDDEGAPTPRRGSGESKSLPSGTRPFLGVGLGDANDGVIIKDVASNSPADSAGMKAQDLIQKVDGKRVTSAEEVVQIVGDHKPGDKLKFSVTREGTAKDVEVTLGKR